jgi:excisionase family DNA binding protein
MNDTQTEPFSMEPLMTPEQVARQLVVSENTLTVWRSTKRQALQFVKIGGLVRYRPSDVAAYVESRLARMTP